MKAYFQLIRWKNLFFLLLALLLLNYCVAAPTIVNMIQDTQLRTWQLFLVILGIICEAAGGYAINDYFDLKIDAINRPQTRIVGRLLDRKAAIQTYLTLSVFGALCGLVVAVVLGSWTLGVLYVFMPGLMWFYSSAYKRQLILGNLIAALSVGVALLTIGIAQNAALHHVYGNLYDYVFSPLYRVEVNVYTFVGCMAGFGAMLALIGNILTNCENIDGDREMECHTLPIRGGMRVTKGVLYALIVLTALAAYIFGQQIPANLGHVNLTQQYLLFLVIIPLCVLLYVVYSAQCRPQWHQARTLLRAISIAAVLYTIVFSIQLHTY